MKLPDAVTLSFSVTLNVSVKYALKLLTLDVRFTAPMTLLPVNDAGFDADGANPLAVKPYS